jgi:hypothetical protein
MSESVSSFIAASISSSSSSGSADQSSQPGSESANPPGKNLNVNGDRRGRGRGGRGARGARAGRGGSSTAAEKSPSILASAMNVDAVEFTPALRSAVNAPVFTPGSVSTASPVSATASAAAASANVNANAIANRARGRRGRGGGRAQTAGSAVAQNAEVAVAASGAANNGGANARRGRRRNNRGGNNAASAASATASAPASATNGHATLAASIDSMASDTSDDAPQSAPGRGRQRKAGAAGGGVRVKRAPAASEISKLESGGYSR